LWCGLGGFASIDSSHSLSKASDGSESFSHVVALDDGIIWFFLVKCTFCVGEDCEEFVYAGKNDGKPSAGKRFFA
jgi:hypothetical protein